MTAVRRWRSGTSKMQTTLHAFEKQMRRKAHYVIKPEHLWASIADMARTQDTMNC